MVKQKFILLLAVLSIYGLPLYGANVCIKNGSVYMNVLRKYIDGVPSHNTLIKGWRADFDYDTKSETGTNGREKIITGLSACNAIVGTFGVPRTNLYTDTTDIGTYCWCKMEPVNVGGAYTGRRLVGITSYWTYLTAFSTEAECDAGCTEACANAVAYDTKISGVNDGFRVKLFQAIW